MKVCRLIDEAILPTRKHPNDAGMDFYTPVDFVVKPHSFAVVRTGITVEIPEDYCLLIKPKSKSNFLLGAGVVDADYQGEILIKVINVLSHTLSFKAGDAIAQGLIFHVFTPKIEEVEKEYIHRFETSRGATGGIVSGLSKIDGID